MTEVTEHGGVVEVSGRSADDVAIALRLFDAAMRERRAHVDSVTDALLTSMHTASVDVLPTEPLAQAKRMAALRVTLISQGCYSHDNLASIRGIGANRVSSVRTWVSRQRDAGRLFTVKHDGRTLIPAFQLTSVGDPRPELAPVIVALRDGGLSQWELWAWLTKPSNLLSGDVPEEVAGLDQDRAVAAAGRFVSQLEPLARRREGEAVKV